MPMPQIYKQLDICQ